ncbi:hypothetical protein Tco_0545151 [Tanacetum coccineum]
MLSLRERMELDLEAKLMGETLVINRSLDLFFEDYIKLTDLNEPFELRRNQGDYLMPTIEEGEVSEERYVIDLASLPKLKGFYKGVLNLVTLITFEMRKDRKNGSHRGHISVYEWNGEVEAEKVLT